MLPVSLAPANDLSVLVVGALTIAIVFCVFLLSCMLLLCFSIDDTAFFCQLSAFSLGHCSTIAGIAGQGGQKRFFFLL